MNSFSNVGYNILSPSYKGFNKFITPSEINKINLYNESPKNHRIKSMGDYSSFNKNLILITIKLFIIRLNNCYGDWVQSPISRNISLNFKKKFINKSFFINFLLIII